MSACESRSKRQLLPLIVCLLPVAQPANGQGAGPSFSATHELTAVRELCGAADRGSAEDSLSGTPETVTGFLTKEGTTLYVPLLSASYSEASAARHMVVFAGHYVEDGQIDSSEGAHASLCAGVLEWRGGTWVLVTRAPELTETGFNGRDPDVKLLQLGERRYGLQVTESLWNHGSAMTAASLYEPVAASFKAVFSAPTSADDCGAGKPCFEFEGTLETDPRSDAGAYDLRLSLKGTYRNAAGRVVRIPPQPLIFSASNGTYSLRDGAPALRAVWQAVQQPW